MSKESKQDKYKRERDIANNERDIANAERDAAVIENEQLKIATQVANSDRDNAIAISLHVIAGYCEVRNSWETAVQNTADNARKLINDIKGIGYGDF